MGVYFDNGSEFLTGDLAGRGHRKKSDWQKVEIPVQILSLLGIEMINALPRNARAKPIERFFYTFKEHYSKSVESYCGGKPDERPEECRKAAEGTLGAGYNYEHFTIYDNINITDEQREAFISLYDPKSVNYRRAIKGDRCVAEGLVFQQFADNPDRFIVSKKYSGVKFISIGVDFGGNKSKVTFVASAVIGNYQALGVIADYKMGEGKGTIDPDRINRELITFYKYVHALYPNARIQYIDCDNASQELTNGIRMSRHGDFRAVYRPPYSNLSFYKNLFTGKFSAYRIALMIADFLALAEIPALMSAE